MYGAKQNIKFPSEHFEIPKTRKDWNSFAFFLVNPCQSLSHKNQHLLNSYKFQEKAKKGQKYRDMPLNAKIIQHSNTNQIKITLHFFGGKNFKTTKILDTNRLQRFSVEQET
jgi:hypothetical protein